MGVTHKEIVYWLDEANLESTEDIQHMTFAGTGCGKCLPLIDQLVQDSSIQKKQ